MTSFLLKSKEMERGFPPKVKTKIKDIYTPPKREVWTLSDNVLE